MKDYVQRMLYFYYNLIEILPTEEKMNDQYFSEPYPNDFEKFEIEDEIRF